MAVHFENVGGEFGNIDGVEYLAVAPGLLESPEEYIVDRNVGVHKPLGSGGMTVGGRRCRSVFREFVERTRPGDAYVLADFRAARTQVSSRTAQDYTNDCGWKNFPVDRFFHPCKPECPRREWWACTAYEFDLAPAEALEEGGFCYAWDPAQFPSKVRPGRRGNVRMTVWLPAGKADPPRCHVSFCSLSTPGDAFSGSSWSETGKTYPVDGTDIGRVASAAVGIFVADNAHKRQG